MSAIGRRELIQSFLDAVAIGKLPEELLTSDMTFWSVNSGTSDKARFAGGVQVLSSLFGGTLAYVIESLTSEDDRTVAEVSSSGTLPDGEAFKNTHLFLCRIQDGRISSVSEYMNQFLVQEKIVPLMQAAMSKPKA